MKIHGLQKMTLLDYPSKVAATVFLGSCDFRCPFCHNFELVDGTAAPIMDDAELFSFLDKRKGLLDGVVITGGEPCLNSSLKDLIIRIKDMGYLVKLDTNGNHPDVLKDLLSENLVDYIAMDVKNSPEKYSDTCGVKIDTEIISESINLIMNSGVDYEFRTTAIKEFHTAEDFAKIGEWICGAKAYYIQQFTERDTVPDKSLSSPSAEDMEAYRQAAERYIKNVILRGL
ncbi:anaerobic ribonucleoside-triphosphate reductase activating protein [Butyrivibrio sp. AD3002]|uniref:anaerobic ribonucleoside-triphosphate reductase activating protein n=1 Tax=Butyrivibrio sp. AD3002 TaxID=1280670 RepID=UPI0003B5F228|nr:anaerobic ribonucleoside-triphosphate reductase activating protein [Butyrivibrio sp. AD3002]